MLNALYTGLSGLDAFDKALQTVSNNITNLNTPGFKSSSFEFSEIAQPEGGAVAEGDSGASSGQGVTYVAPYLNLTQGQITGAANALDLAIQGNGFFAVSKDGNTGYLRTGQFSVIDSGAIVDHSSGYQLNTLNASGALVPASIKGHETNAPQATTKVVFSNNLSSTGTSASVANITVYDAAGGTHTLSVQLTPDATTTGKWTVNVTDDTGQQVGTGSINYNSSLPDTAHDTLSISIALSGGATLPITLDFSGTTNFASGSSSTLTGSASDGYASGALTGESVNSQGNLILTYSNNQTTNLGNVALATFTNPQQLQQQSNGIFEHAGSSGVRLTVSGDANAGDVQGNATEGSNVDLSSEFGNLIIVQRGYQASSQVVSTVNDMLQQLLGIRGQ